MDSDDPMSVVPLEDEQERVGYFFCCKKCWRRERDRSKKKYRRTCFFPSSFEEVQLLVIHGNVKHIAMGNGPGLKMYFLLKMGIFQPAMLVYWRVFEASQLLPKKMTNTFLGDSKLSSK